MMSNEALWLAGRVTGFAAVLLLTLSAMGGLALSMKISSPRYPRWLNTELHRYITLLALGLSAAHVLTLWADTQAGLSLVNLVIPFTSSYEALGIGLGVIGLELAVVVWLTTRWRDRIGYRRWQVIHRTASIAWVAVMLHALLAGSDTHQPWATLFYVLCFAGVMALLVPRLARTLRST